MSPETAAAAGSISGEQLEASSNTIFGFDLQFIPSSLQFSSAGVAASLLCKVTLHLLNSQPKASTHVSSTAVVRRQASRSLRCFSAELNKYNLKSMAARTWKVCVGVRARQREMFNQEQNCRPRNKRLVGHGVKSEATPVQVRGASLTNFEVPYFPPPPMLVYCLANGKHHIIVDPLLAIEISISYQGYQEHRIYSFLGTLTCMVESD